MLDSRCIVYQVHCGYLGRPLNQRFPTLCFISFIGGDSLYNRMATANLFKEAQDAELEYKARKGKTILSCFHF